MKKFHAYLYGCEFTLVTDHKPLTEILGPKKGIPPLATARLQRWALLLSAHKYQVEFRPTEKHANADGLSRLPVTLKGGEGSSSEPGLFNVNQINALPVTSKVIQGATRKDPPTKCSTPLHAERMASTSTRRAQAFPHQEVRDH